MSVAARATRQALKEEQRVAAERRAAVTLKVQHWENGKAGPSVRWARSLSSLRKPASLIPPATPRARAGVDRQARRRAALNALTAPTTDDGRKTGARQGGDDGY